MTAESNRGRIRLLLDTADRAAWEEWLPTGLVVTIDMPAARLAS